ncbi:triose-phosphate transporter family-domain-containing protein [Mariannaea sp. PMI_226]|nr:triose-phosphate transporter family-domain-containing protein [Mariannaea sp. PMI_226]
MAIRGDLEEARVSSQPVPQSEEEAEKLDDGPSTPPSSEAGRGLGLHASVYILGWMFFSNMTILFNKWLIDTANFRYPIILTTWHLIFATVATQILARTSTLLDSRHKLPISRRFFLRIILPIGVFYSGSLVFSNVVYLYLSVPFIQMLKSAGPVAVLLASWAWGVADPDLKTLVNVLIIVFGVAIASIGEIQFSWLGFAFQLTGTIFEAIRLVMIQVMLKGEGIRMDPLVGLYYYAPVCAVMNIFVVAVTEFPKFKFADAQSAGLGMLFLNALAAFFLNIVSVFLIGKTSSLVMALTGILKSILLVAVSVLIWSTPISLLQTFGYSIALVGLVLYSVEYQRIVEGLSEFRKWLHGVWNDENPAERKLSLKVRRSIIIGIIGFVTIAFAVAMWHIFSLSGGDISSMTASWFGSSST